MLRQTVAIFLDAYRELHARKLFWVTLVLSGLVVVLFGLVSIDEEGISLAGWRLDFIPDINSDTLPPDVLFKQLFIQLGIQIWLTWIATILALVSTAGMVPDLISSGSIDLILSRPIGRLRLFLTKVVAGTLFVALQVTVFTTASFLVIGLRGGAWEPGLFIAIPIVVLFFSYLFSISVFIGMITRSTIAALLMTMLAWLAFFVVDATEGSLLAFRRGFEYQVERLDASIAEQEQSALGDTSPREEGEGEGNTEEDVAEDGPDEDAKIEAAKRRLDESRAEREEVSSTVDKLAIAHNIAYGIKTVTPKTGETVALLERWLTDYAALLDDDAPPPDANVPMVGHPEVQRRLVEEIHSRSIGWVVGTSLAFEAVMLGLASWLFCRRDY